MINKIALLFLTLIFTSSMSFSQEIDDMYFNSKDRVTKKVKEITPAEVILSKYRSGITATNSNDKIDTKILDRYKLETTSEYQSSNQTVSKIQSLKFNRDNLYKSKSITDKFLDINLNLMLGNIRPNYYHLFDNYMYFNNGYDSYFSNMWMPRNLYGIRALASYDPMMFFSNPYYSFLSSMTMGPSYYNLHYPGLSTYGLGACSRFYPSWIFNGYNSGGLQHTLSNRHYYVKSKPETPTIRGPRSGRFSVMAGGDSRSDRKVDRYFGRRESGITNTMIQKERGSNVLDDTQNNYMRQHSSRVQSFATRSSRSNSYQNSVRKSESQSRLRSSRIQSINNSFSGNTLRSTRNPSSMSSVDDMSGRRSAYSASSNFSSSRSYGSSRSTIFGSGSSSRSTSGPVFSTSSSGRSSSGGGYSSGSRSSGRSSGGGAVVSRGGSSGGSSRGRN